MNSFASVKASGFQDPHILPYEVTHRHDETTRAIGESLHSHLVSLRVPHLSATLADQRQIGLLHKVVVEALLQTDYLFIQFDYLELGQSRR